MKFSGFNTTEKVGIGFAGTSLPNQTLVVKASLPVIALESSNSQGRIDFRDGSTVQATIGLNPTHGDSFNIALGGSLTSDVKLLVKPDGNVGIGTTSPAALLDVRGTVKVGVNDAGHDVMLYGATSGRYWEWDQSMDLVRMRDNVKTVFGNGDDLQMYFDGTDGYIKNHVGGALRIRTKGDFTVQTNASDGGAEDAIKAINNGAVELPTFSISSQ